MFKRNVLSAIVAYSCVIMRLGRNKMQARQKLFG